jgi:hypothetical protein
LNPIPACAAYWRGTLWARPSGLGFFFIGIPSMLLLSNLRQTKAHRAEQALF